MSLLEREKAHTVREKEVKEHNQAVERKSTKIAIVYQEVLQMV